MMFTGHGTMTDPAALTEPLFYCAAFTSDADVILTGAEAHHVTVQRLRPGDAIAVFNGRGQVARGRIQTISRTAVNIAVEQRYQARPPSQPLDLYCALPKGDRLATLLDMATQLGVAKFTPIRWHRSVVVPAERNQERWQRICLEACKQSRRVYLPELAPTSMPEAAATAAGARGDCLIVAHPERGADAELLPNCTGASRIALFVGPEGGLTEDEVEMFGCLAAQFVSLGPAILRIETAAVALLSIVNSTATRAL
jgi:16S rRNA (uracil1498-N3)-methyltransferase